MEEEEEEVQNQQLKQAAAVSKQQPPALDKPQQAAMARAHRVIDREVRLLRRNMEPLVGCDS